MSCFHRSSIIPWPDRCPSHNAFPFCPWIGIFQAEHIFQDTFDTLVVFDLVVLKNSSEEERKSTCQSRFTAYVRIIWSFVCRSQLDGEKIESYVLPLPNVRNWTKGTLGPLRLDTEIYGLRWWQPLSHMPPNKPTDFSDSSDPLNKPPTVPVQVFTPHSIRI